MLQRRLIHSSKTLLNRKLTPLTHIKHPEFKRDPAFSQVNKRNKLEKKYCINVNFYRIIDNKQGH